MWWEYYGDAAILVGTLSAILILFFIHFLRTKYKRSLAIHLFISILGYISILIGVVFVRGWNGLGWATIGAIIMGIGIFCYIGVRVYKTISEYVKE